ncbi:3-hydroxyacyl-CoA dehydrogenase NAD-binding domain-containing protein, partial [Staphylococcus warneri]|uniref:3-hydroxyacyl-CoA dehydrogenase NAD-binding domain-containing protein n=1 Tax=Staphylococcus warneri TaxID=1292 RepID=UPI0021B45308
EQKVEQPYQSIQFTTTIPHPPKHAHILIQPIPQLLSIKTHFYKQLPQTPPQKTIFPTNSSTFPPTQFKHVTGTPEK